MQNTQKPRNNLKIQKIENFKTQKPRKNLKIPKFKKHKNQENF